MTQKITASDIRSAILKRFPAQEYAVMFEVGDATGASQKRWADAIVMSLWPSRGLEIHGIEIKVSRSDWKREAADPTKAERIARFCDKWSVYTSPGVVGDILSVPPAWGVEEFDGKAFKTIKRAEKTEAQELTRGFVAAMLRRADGITRTMIKEAEETARVAAREALESERLQINEVVERRVSQRTAGMGRVEEVAAAIKESTGVDIMSRRDWEYRKILDAIGLMHTLNKAGFGGDYSSVRHHVEQLSQAAKIASEALSLFHVSKSN